MKTSALFGLWLLVSGLCSAATPLPNARLTGTAEVPAGGILDVNGTLDLTDATVTGLPGQSAKITSLDDLDGGANYLPFFTDTDEFGQTTFTAYAQSMLGLGTSSDWRSAILPASPVAGDIVYYNGSSWSKQTLPTGIPKVSLGVLTAAVQGTDYVPGGLITASGLTLAAPGLVGRSSGGGGAIEAIGIADGLMLDGVNLYATGLYRSRVGINEAYTVLAADRGKLIDCTAGSFVVTMASANTLGSGFLVGVYNSGTGVITIDPAEAETIRDPSGVSSTKTLAEGEGVSLVSNGTGWLVAMQAKAVIPGFTNPMTTVGDLMIGGVSGTATRLAAGAYGHVLTSNGTGTAPSWQASLANPMTAVGDLIVGGTAGAAGRLAAGTDGKVLKIVAGTPAWADDSTGSGSLPGSPATGDLIYYGDDEWVRLPAGTDGQVLTLDSGLPSWEAASGGGGGITGPSGGGEVSFTYSSDGDTNGVFYWFGTNFGTTTWGNPVTAERLKVLLGGTGSMTAASIVDRADANNNYYVQAGNQWIAFDLGTNHALACSHYSLRNGGSTYNPPTNFVLEGSNDVAAWTSAGINAATWVAVDSRTGVTSLATYNSTATFATNGDAATAYRYFRYRHTTSVEYVILNEVELYGTVFENPPTTASSVAIWTDGTGTVLGNSGVKIDEAGNVIASGALRTTLAGKGLEVKEGSNAKMGTATLAAGTATVATTAVSSTSRIFITSQADGGTPGFIRVSGRTSGTSFTITSSSASDTSTVAWLIVEPSP